MNFAGFPPTTVNGSTSFVTTAPAATTAPFLEDFEIPEKRSDRFFWDGEWLAELRADIGKIPPLSSRENVAGLAVEEAAFEEIAGAEIRETEPLWADFANHSRLAQSEA